MVPVVFQINQAKLAKQVIYYYGGRSELAKAASLAFTPFGDSSPPGFLYVWYAQKHHRKHHCCAALPKFLPSLLSHLRLILRWYVKASRLA